MQVHILTWSCRSSLPLVLQFPTMEKAMSALKSKRYPKRSRTVPSSFVCQVSNQWISAWIAHPWFFSPMLRNTKMSFADLYMNTYRYAEVSLHRVSILTVYEKILLLNYGIYYYSLYKAFGQRSDAERNFRSKGVGLYSSCHLQRYTIHGSGICTYSFLKE